MIKSAINVQKVSRADGAGARTLEVDSSELLTPARAPLVALLRSCALLTPCARAARRAPTRCARRASSEQHGPLRDRGARAGRRQARRPGLLRGAQELRGARRGGAGRRAALRERRGLGAAHRRGAVALRVHRALVVAARVRAGDARAAVERRVVPQVQEARQARAAPLHRAGLVDARRPPQVPHELRRRLHGRRRVRHRQQVGRVARRLLCFSCVCAIFLAFRTTATRPRSRRPTTTTAARRRGAAPSPRSARRRPRRAPSSRRPTSRSTRARSA